MAGLQSFDAFTKLKAEQKAAEVESKNNQIREESARSFKDLLSEYGVAKVSELSEEQRTEFFTRLEGTDLNESLSLVEEGTRSWFGKIDKKGDIKAVYMHYDGYPENMLPLISKGYTGPKRKNIDVVIKNGAGSGLEANPRDINYYNDGEKEFVGNVGRIRDFIGDAKNSWAEYIYLFDERDGMWYMADTHSDDNLVPAFEGAKINGENTNPEGYPSPAGDSDDVYSDELMENAINESSLAITGKRAAKKVLKQWNFLMNERYSLVGGKYKQKPVILGATRVIFENAMEDANFSREGNAIASTIKGKLENVVVNVEGLGNMEVKVSAASIKKSLMNEASRISSAAGWSGVGIVEGTALFLEQLGEDLMGATLINKFNSQFESAEVLEKKVAEGNAFGDAVRKAKEAGEEEFEFQGKTYKVEEACWKGYKQIGMKDKNGKQVPNCVPESEEVNEAEIESDEDFKEYAFTVLQKAFGEDFDEDKGQEVVDGILAKADGDYGAAVGMLTSSLG